MLPASAAEGGAVLVLPAGSAAVIDRQRLTLVWSFMLGRRFRLPWRAAGRPCELSLTDPSWSTGTTSARSAESWISAKSSRLDGDIGIVVSVETQVPLRRSERVCSCSCSQQRERRHVRAGTRASLPIGSRSKFCVAFLVLFFGAQFAVYPEYSCTVVCPAPTQRRPLGAPSSAPDRALPRPRVGAAAPLSAPPVARGATLSARGARRGAADATSAPQCRPTVFSLMQ